MEPIAELTATAREIERTRDAKIHIPKPEAEDEVAELAATLESMLRALDEARTETEASLARQREFVADASHELRTPLTSVLANLELLEETLQGDQRDAASSALRSSRRMRRLVADLLLLARADAGRLQAHSPCDLAEIAGEAAAEAAPLMGERRLSIENDRALRVEGSRDELHRMVLNLLDNAACHTPEDARVELRLREEDGAAVLEVADDGPGVPVAMRDQIFGRFVRGEGPADRAAGKGTGLGLAIVSAVTEAHGGAVEAGESRHGGALFVVRIPLAPAAKARSEPLAPL
jgi:signal transduction histidine kinase